MKIAIIGAMDNEVKHLLSQVNSYKTNEYFKYTFYEANFFGKDLIITSSGIGKVASGLLVSALVNRYENIDLIINVGISGGVFGKINIGEIVVANKLSYLDVDVTIFPKYVYGQVPNCPPYFTPSYNLLAECNLDFDYSLGMIASGDQFYHRQEEVEKLINLHFEDDNVLCVDMESCALAQSSWFYNIDYLAIRAISDVIGSSSQDDQYNSNLDLACKNSNEFLINLLEKL